MTRIRLKLVTTPSQFAATVQFLLAPKVNKILKKTNPAIESRVSELLRVKMNSSDTIQELKNGQLKVDFGLTDSVADAATKDIVNAVASAVQIFIRPPKSKKAKTLGSLVIEINPSIVSAVVQTSTTNAIYNSNGHQITWLNWLMTKGTEVVVEDFEVVSGLGYDERSRSGGGLMIRTGGAFRVHPDHAGTAGDNFITKAIIANGPNIRKIIQEEFRRLF